MMWACCVRNHKQHRNFNPFDNIYAEYSLNWVNSIKNYTVFPASWMVTKLKITPKSRHLIYMSVVSELINTPEHYEGELTRKMIGTPGKICIAGRSLYFFTSN